MRAKTDVGACMRVVYVVYIIYVGTIDVLATATVLFRSCYLTYSYLELTLVSDNLRNLVGQWYDVRTNS